MENLRGLSYSAAIIGFGAIAVAIVPEFITYPLTNMLTATLGYPMFLLLIFCVAFAMYVTAQTFLKLAWRDRRILASSLAVGSAYGLFFAFVSNMISRPDQATLNLLPESMRLSGFTAVLQAYGPYTFWPILEIWSPSTGFFVAISVGTALLLVMLTVLMVYSVTLVMLNFKNRDSARRSGTGQVVGSVTAALFSNACGCCTSLLLPAFAGIFGVSATSSAFQVINGAPEIFDLLATVNLGLLVSGILLSARRLSSCNLPQ